MCNLQVIDDRPCNSTPPVGLPGRGVTTWQKVDFSINSNDTVWLDFTCTIPKCYYNDSGYASILNFYGQDSCNVSFKAAPNSGSPDEIEVGVKLYNDSPNNPNTDNAYHWTAQNPRNCDSLFFCGQSGHDSLQTFELCNVNDNGPAMSGGEKVRVYRDVGKNWIGLHNPNSMTITIKNFRILRIYKMCTSTQDALGYCDGSYGSVGVDVGDDGTLDPSRSDKPCNTVSCGGWSASNLLDKNHRDGYNDLLTASNSFNWYFSWAGNTANNYVGPIKCIFNFNEMKHSTTVSNDIDLAVYVNNNYYTTIWLTKIGNHKCFPSLDLTQDLGYGTFYNDSTTNHIELRNNSNTTIDFNDQAGINIYRVYETTPVYMISVSYGSGGTISPDNTPVNEGDSQEFTITANIGYTIADVQVNSTSIGAVSSYTFYSVNSNQTISATFSYCGSCQGGCQTCDGTCYGCQAACQWFCVTCDACYGTCQNCYDTCVGCDSCDACNGCNENYVPCCDACDGCVTCVDCVTCVICQTPCEACASCYQDCYNVCYQGCYEGAYYP